jgi:signal transduction histidine kinase
MSFLNHPRFQRFAHACSDKLKKVKAFIMSTLPTQPLAGLNAATAQHIKSVHGQNYTSPAAPSSPQRPFVFILWMLLILVCLCLYIFSIPDRYAQLMDVSIHNSAILYKINLPPNFLALYVIVLELITVLFGLLVACVIVWHKRDTTFTLVVALMITLFGIWVTRPMETLNPAHPFIYISMSVLRAVGQILVVITCFTVPSGRFAPRWTFLVAIAWTAITVIWLLFPHTPFNGIYSPYPQAPLPLDVLLFSFFWYAIGLIAQIQHYFSSPNPVARYQNKWIMLGVAGTLFGIVAFKVFNTLVFKYDLLLWYILGEFAYYAVSLLMPVSFAIAILRYHLWNIDVIINRFFVYSCLTLCIITIYVCIVGVLGAVLRAIGDFSISLVATSIVALLFQFLRNLVQRVVDRMMYGYSEDPYVVVSRLWQRMDSVMAPEMVFDVLVEIVQQAVKSPYVALYIKQDASFQFVASSGSLLDKTPLSLPLIYQKETVGALVCAHSSAHGNFTSAEFRLLRDLALPAGVAIYATKLAVRLNAEAQHSRERLVVAREEERRRLRRDFHDGLGPTLGSILLKIGAARVLLFKRPAEVELLMKSLETDVKGSIADLRRLIYALRPPELDDLGLMNALFEYVSQCNLLASTCMNSSDQEEGLFISMEVPPTFPPLAAAVEVAAYHIVREALNNVMKHAQARTCVVRFTVSTMLQIEVIDNGKGLPEQYKKGVGLHSLHERARELGGTCLVGPALSGGTRVFCKLPLPLHPFQYEL